MLRRPGFRHVEVGRLGCNKPFARRGQRRRVGRRPNRDAVDRAVDLISKRVLAEVREREFALTRLEGATASAEEVEIAARTASLFGGRRLVVVREFQRIKEKELTRLLHYLENPVRHSCAR